MNRGLVVALGVGFAGCLQQIGPDVGPLASGSNTDASACAGDSDPAVSISYQNDIVGGIFRRGKCTNCHTGGGQGVNQSGFDISSYTTLRTGGGRSGAHIVIDGMPCASIIVQKIETAPPFGRRMPYNGPPYLSAADITMMRDWIAEGARDN